MRWTAIRGKSLEQTSWRNRRGTSRTIVSRLARDATLLWQVSLADLVADAPFSHYPAHERIFTPIAGDAPVELSFNDGPFAPCPLLVPRSFPGEWTTEARVRSPGRAFNVIFARDQFHAEVQVLRLEAGDPVEAPDAPEVVIHCVSGELACLGEVLEAGDSLLGPGPAAPGAAATDATAITVAVWPRS